MKHLARAVVESFAFLEVSDDDTVDPDDAASAMEGMSATFSECSTAERKALAAAEAFKEASHLSHAKSRWLFVPHSWNACLKKSDQ